jgi:hypothetical protein
LDEDALKKKLLVCETCKSPTFHGRDFYLPFCHGEKSFPNLCKAVCEAESGGGNLMQNPPSKGSCDRCEVDKCSQIFLPVCTLDGRRLFANKCHAKCAGEEEFGDCTGLNMVIPGKTPLPPNKELPQRLQNFGQDKDDLQEELF